MTTPETPAYLQLWAAVDAILTRHFKGWAYTLSLSGSHVSVHHRSNVAEVRRLLAKAGLLDQVTVVYLSS